MTDLLSRVPCPQACCLPRRSGEKSGVGYGPDRVVTLIRDPAIAQVARDLFANVLVSIGVRAPDDPDPNSPALRRYAFIPEQAVLDPNRGDPQESIVKTTLCLDYCWWAAQSTTVTSASTSFSSCCALPESWPLRPQKRWSSPRDPTPSTHEPRQRSPVKGKTVEGT